MRSPSPALAFWTTELGWDKDHSQVDCMSHKKIQKNHPWKISIPIISTMTRAQGLTHQLHPADGELAPCIKA